MCVYKNNVQHENKKQKMKYKYVYVHLYKKKKKCFNHRSIIIHIIVIVTAFESRKCLDFFFSFFLLGRGQV